MHRRGRPGKNPATVAPSVIRMPVAAAGCGRLPAHRPQELGCPRFCQALKSFGEAIAGISPPISATVEDCAYLLSPACQLSTTVIGDCAASPAATVIKNFWPSGENCALYSLNGLCK